MQGVSSKNETSSGSALNFSSALMLKSSDLVFLSIKDDIWFPKKIQHMLDLATVNGSALIFMSHAALNDSEFHIENLTASFKLPLLAWTWRFCDGVLLRNRSEVLTV